MLVGLRIVVAANNDSAREAAEAMSEAGAAITIVDSRLDADTSRRPKSGSAGRTHARKVERGRRGDLANGADDPADRVLVSGGLTRPSIGLPGRGKLVWNEGLAAFTPAQPVAA